MLKRAHKGVYHKFQRKAPWRYVNEFSLVKTVRERDTIDSNWHTAAGDAGSVGPDRRI